MKKIMLIIQREYLSRVKKKSFLLLTFLVPVLFIAMIALIAYIGAKQNEFGDVKKVAVIDESGRFLNKMKGSANMTFTYVNQSFDTAKRHFIKDGNDYLLYIPAGLTGVQLLGEKKPGPMTSGKIEDELSNVIRSQRLIEAGIDTAVLAKAQKHIDIAALQVKEDGTTEDAHIYAAYGVGFVCAFLIYLSLFLYGAQVMRGVIEEKVSRIIEVIISSVKPMQLMLGKIIGVGLVGLTQFVLWIVLTLVLSTVAGTVLVKGSKVKTEQITQMQQAVAQSGANMSATTDTNMSGKVMAELQGIPVTKTIFCFLFYFLFGYLLYSALFAAVGSAVDNETETQQFMIPITLPLIFTFAIAQSVIINNPDSTLSIWLSIIPFTAPIAMMIRIPFDGVDNWQLALSMFMMVAGFLFTTWIAARIYRVGILMYGKKASYKELAKWFMYKE
jgi:ABC-2 type transport system permease protein